MYREPLPALSARQIVSCKAGTLDSMQFAAALFEAPLLPYVSEFSAPSAT